MGNPQVDLEITKLKIRCEIHDALLAKLILAMWLAIPGTSRQESRARALEELEGLQEGLGTILFSSPQYASFDEVEKAQYYEEMREIVDHMKQYVNLLGEK